METQTLHGVTVHDGATFIDPALLDDGLDLYGNERAPAREAQLPTLEQQAERLQANAWLRDICVPAMKPERAKRASRAAEAERRQARDPLARAAQSINLTVGQVVSQIQGRARSSLTEDVPPARVARRRARPVAATPNLNRRNTGAAPFFGGVVAHMMKVLAGITSSRLSETT